jgi:HSP20 family molecular chaperone IbpA
MSETPRRSQSPPLLDFGDLLDPFHLLWGARSSPDSYGIRIETRFEDGAYLVHAELPGIDPAKDVEVTVTDGTLAIRAERSERKGQRHHSEFRYGSHTRTVHLPEGAKEDAVTATYKGGILTIRVPMEKKAKAAGRTIKVETAE